MKIDTSNYLTPAEVMESLGCSRRGVYRAVTRARAAGHVVTEEVFGKTLILRSALPVLKQNYFPYYSESHQSMVKEWGSRGGTAKAKNAAARQGGRKRAAANGKSGERA